MTTQDAMPQDLDARFRAQAAEEGLLDVAYDMTDSPVGRLLVATTERGLCRIAFDPEPDRTLDELARAFGSRVLRSPKPLDRTRRELDEYFQGRLHQFDLEVDLTAVTDFHRSVLQELARVPYGQTATYGGLALKLGRPSAARAIGGAMNRNPIPIVLPCHRVVGAHGELTGYAGGLERKAALLELEGALPHGLFE
jgi:methylated-DNA-[protein]-cysteine S-methyltransferase